jgi:phosphoenolpyruvate synthase/pyruvate phosphate dikinase
MYNPDMTYEVKELKKEDLVLADWAFEAQQRGEQPISLCDFFCRALSSYLVEDISGEKGTYNYLFTDSNRLYNYPREAEIYFGKLRERVKDRAFLREIIESSIEIPRRFNEASDEAMIHLEDEGVTNEKIAELWKTMDERFTRTIPWFWYPWYLSKENVVTDEVKRGLERYRADVEKLVDFDEALLTIVFPIKKTLFQLEQEDMCELVKLAQARDDFADDPAFGSMAREYLMKYDWLTTFILTPVYPMTRTELIERVRRAREENFEENHRAQKEANEKNRHTAEKVMTLLEGDENLLADIADARELAYVLTAGIEEAYISASKYLKLMQIAAERIGVSFTEMKYLLSKEVYQLLMGQMKREDIDLEERKKGFVMMILGGQQYALYGDPGHALSLAIDTALNTVDTSIKEFKGQVACKGRASGRVKVATTPGEAHELKAGEILVCPMTNPDYVPAMKRSAAIVTDEGGLLSHAAIMSREFGKPCVIATKIATKLLKDGDQVEVDAEKGIVRIIK